MADAIRASGAAVFAAVLLAGCGGGGGGEAGGQAEEAEQSSPSAAASSAAAEDQGGTEPTMDGVWQSIVDDSDIQTLTIVDGKAETTGKLACPGTLDLEAAAEGEGETARTAPIELGCETPDPKRETGTVELHEDGDKLVIQWDGPEWGGYIDSFTLTDEEPAI